MHTTQNDIPINTRPKAGLEFLKVWHVKSGGFWKFKNFWRTGIFLCFQWDKNNSFIVYYTSAKLNDLEVCQSLVNVIWI